MSLIRVIEEYFSLLDAGESEKAALMFDPEGRVNSPWENGIAPTAFIQKHIESAPIRNHEIMDVLISESGKSAAVHFEFSSRGNDGQEKPTLRS